MNSVMIQAPAEVLRITTVRGRTIEVTKNHRFLVMSNGRRPQDLTHEYSWVRADKLNINDRVKVALGNLSVETETKQELLEAWALGAWIGDGECGRFRFICADSEIVDAMREYIESIGSTLVSRLSTRQLQGINKKDYPYEHAIKGIGKRRRCVQGCQVIGPKRMEN